MGIFRAWQPGAGTDALGMSFTVVRFTIVRYMLHGRGDTLSWCLAQMNWGFWELPLQVIISARVQPCARGLLVSGRCRGCNRCVAVLGTSEIVVEVGEQVWGRSGQAAEVPAPLFRPYGHWQCKVVPTL